MGQNYFCIGSFEELYFYPTTFGDIVEAMRIYNKNSLSCPIVKVHLDEIGSCNSIDDLITTILDYNQLIGYHKTINIEIRLRKATEIEHLNFFQKLFNRYKCMISVVVDDSVIKEKPLLIGEQISSLRVNYYNNLIDCIDLSMNRELIDYAFARFTVSEYTNYKQICEQLIERGFDGIQIIKGHLPEKKQIA